MPDGPATLAHAIERRCAEHASPGAGSIRDALAELSEPAIFRGLVADWPAVAHARDSATDLCRYLLSFDVGADVSLFKGAADCAGRIFYNDNFTDLNCTRTRTELSAALNEIEEAGKHDTGEVAYIGSTPVASCLPGFAEENGLDFSGVPTLMNLWIGGPSRISAHYDFADNLACVVAGSRQFILFPPDQLENLYIGPLDFTPAGQPISVVDFNNPDFETFPLFEVALRNAVVADLNEGDALFIPSMWWHHVSATASFNLLVNYWYRRAPQRAGAPNDAFQHALMTIRDLPCHQREAWRVLFRYYVFENDGMETQHIPRHAQGILGELTPEQARAIRAKLRQRLNS